MPVFRWDPYSGMSVLQDRINRLFDDTLSPGGLEPDEVPLCAWQPPVDIYDTEEVIIITAELPGIEKEEISVEVKQNVLTIRGERKVPAREDNRNYLRQERSFGAFHRAFSLPDPVSPDRVRARFKNGMLRLEIPKQTEQGPRRISVDID